jgi:putative protein-disulfide isomerase
MAVEVRYITDPACPVSWGAEPLVRRLVWEFGDGLRFRWVLGGLARSYGPTYRDDEGAIGAGPDVHADLLAHWLEHAAASGMPIDPRIWRAAPLGSSYPACMAVRAAAEQGPQAAGAMLRRLREAIMAERVKADHAEALVAQAGQAGLDAARFRIDLESNAILEAFGADLAEARAVPDEARAAGHVRRSGETERLPFPTAIFLAESGERHAVYGPRPYEELRAAALAAGAAPEREERPGVLEAVERFGRLATREVEELTGKPGPVVRAELWGLAREWRLRPRPALTGELWELA